MRCMMLYMRPSMPRARKREWTRQYALLVARTRKTQLLKAHQIHFIHNSLLQRACASMINNPVTWGARARASTTTCITLEWVLYMDIFIHKTLALRVSIRMRACEVVVIYLMVRYHLYRQDVMCLFISCVCVCVCVQVHTCRINLCFRCRTL